jgi:transposase InsO family protein
MMRRSAQTLTQRKYCFILERQVRYSIEDQCRVLKVSRSGYYRWRTAEIPQRQKENVELMRRTRHHFHRYRGRYGSPRLTKVLQQEGLRCSRNRIARLMREHGLQARPGRSKRCRTTISGPAKASPNLLRTKQKDRNFTSVRPGEKLTSDITYIPVRTLQKGWLYVATVMDLCTRKIVGLSIRNDLTEQLAIEALQQAIRRGAIGKKSILHSDRGAQYTANEYRAILKQHGIRQSMSRKGNCWDNAPMESFFKTMKSELWRPGERKRTFQTEEEARRAIFEYIEIFYNRQRMHSALNYQTPEAFAVTRQPDNQSSTADSKSTVL